MLYVFITEYQCVKCGDFQRTTLNGVTTVTGRVANTTCPVPGTTSATSVTTIVGCTNGCRVSLAVRIYKLYGNSACINCNRHVPVVYKYLSATTMFIVN